MDDPQALEIELPHRDWDPGLRKWRLPQAVVRSVTEARLWIDNTEVPEGQFRLANGHIELLSTDWDVTSEHSVRTALKLRRSAHLSTFMQNLILSAVGIAPALLTFFVTEIRPSLSTTDLRATAVVSMLTRVDDAVRHAHNIRLVSNWLPQWVLNSSLAEAMQNGATVNLSFLDSTSAALPLRSTDLSDHPGFALERLRTGLDLLAQMKKLVQPQILQTQFTLRYHRSLGSVLILQCDDTYFIGPFLHGKSVSDAFLVEVKAKAQTKIAAVLQHEISLVMAEGQVAELPE